MAKAMVVAVGVEITCPECDEGLTAPNGSFLWETHEYETVAGTRVQCDTCEKWISVPRLVRVPCLAPR